MPAPSQLDLTTGPGLYGAELRRCRLAAGKTLTDLACEVRYSVGHLSDIERARTRVPYGLSETLDNLFNTNGHFCRLWPLTVAAHPAKYADFMASEAAARQVEEYAPAVPGLLQTPGYARAVLRAATPRQSEAQIEERLVQRLARQQRLHTNDRPSLWAILDESAIRRAVGGASVMRDQLSHLLSLVDTPSTTIQVLPFDAGAHPALGGSLTLHTLPSGSRMAYVEGFGSGDLTDDPARIAEYLAVYDRLRALALSPEQSAALIRSAEENT